MTDKPSSVRAGEDLALRSRRRPAKANPLQSAIWEYFNSRHNETQAEAVPDRAVLPKRYTLYPPMLLLPPNFLSHSVDWQACFSGLDEGEIKELFASIVMAFQVQGITHVAINSPISIEDASNNQPNAMRSPTGLLPVYGNFGPHGLLSDRQPSPTNFEKAFWISAVQNGGIVQIWAPLWTMFSRGNVSEKARILGEGGRFKGFTEEDLGQELGKVDVVDFYVGIGYFAFSYLRRGVRRVWGWDINGWSIEGLRRGAERNGWDVRIIRVDDNGLMAEGEMVDLVSMVSKPDSCERRCIVFHGDNRWTGKVLASIAGAAGKSDEVLNVRHCNLGLLPTSRRSWEDATRCLDQQKGGWLHVHENVDIHEIEERCGKIVEQIQNIAHDQRGQLWNVSCCHIEHVKTYAPGVMHCVFDIEILPAR